MQVDEELQKVLDNLPAEEPRSRLEPLRQFILRWRQEGRSYKRIREILHDQCHLKVAHATLFEFVQRRSRPRKFHPEAEPQPVTVAQAPTNQVVIGRPRLRRSPEEIAAMRAAASADNHKPGFPPEEETKPLFVYDPDNPVTTKPTKEK